MTTTLTASQNAFKYWAPIAYTRFILYSTAYILRTTVRHIFGRTPKGQSLLASYTIQILKLIMGLKVLNISQARAAMILTLDYVHLKNGTFRQSSKDKWAANAVGEGWSGYWIPFKDQSSKKNLQDALKTKPSSDIGSGCDLVVLAIH
ncbi:hypothetical protein BGX27_010105, partial [Mortierella sp. AM989]